jgi:hypothetical protein
LHRQAQTTGDQRLTDLYDELKAYPGGQSQPPPATDVVVPLRYRSDNEELSFISLTTVLGTPMDVIAAEGERLLDFAAPAGTLPTTGRDVRFAPVS